MRHMTRLMAAITAVGLSGAVAMADPAAMPIVNGSSRPLVQVFQFTSVNDTAHQDWIGQGIQANLQTDVSQTGAILVMTPKAPAAGTDPVAVAKQDGANLAVVGSYQIVADQVRVNAHLVDTASSSTVGSFSATGPQQDLFKIEDALGEQLRRLLPLPGAPQQAAAQVAPQTPAYQQPAPQQMTTAAGPSVVAYTPPPDNSYYTTTPVATTPYYYPDSFYPSDYGSDYYYPDYGYYGGVYVGGPFYYGGPGRFHDYGGFGGYGFHGGVGFRSSVYIGGGGYHGGFSGGYHGGGGGFHGGGGGFHGGGGGGGRR